MLSAILSSWSILTVYTATRIFASCRPPAKTLTSIGEKYGLTKARTRQIPLESKPAFLYQSFEQINETTAVHIINMLEERIPEFRSKADLRGE